MFLDGVRSTFLMLSFGLYNRIISPENSVKFKLFFLLESSLWIIPIKLLLSSIKSSKYEKYVKSDFLSDCIKLQFSVTKCKPE
jgi:hypothetical protein